MLGKTTDVKDLFVKSQRGIDIIPFTLFKLLRDKLLGSILFL